MGILRVALRAGLSLFLLAINHVAGPLPAGGGSTPSEVRAQLGLRLFFDSRLSGNNKMSCADCHIPERAFTDGRRRAVGSRGTVLRRNTPTLIQSVNRKNQFWDGRVQTLEEQALEPLRNPDEMDQDPNQLIGELKSDPEYVRLFRESFGSEISLPRVAEAIAAFERTLISQNSPFDQYMMGNREAISLEAVKGMGIFQGKGKCALCHSGLDFTDDLFHNIGVSESDPGKADLGRYHVTRKKADRGAFKTPTLRNVDLTGPYMHNGSMETLDEVAAFYNKGGGKNSHRDELIAPLGLSKSEERALVAFLKSLTGTLPRVIPPRFN